MNRFFPIKNVENLPQDIENDIAIKDQMAHLGAFLACTLGPFLAPVLIDAHTLNNAGDPGYDNGYETNEDED